MTVASRFRVLRAAHSSNEPKWCVIGMLVLLASQGTLIRGDDDRPETLIGYTELQTNLPGGRHANVATMRAMLVQADGRERRPVAGDLAREADSWTQFAGWSPDGRTAIVGRGWENPENARWEEEHKTFRFTPEGYLFDLYVVEMNSGRSTNLTAVERVSFYNSG